MAGATARTQFVIASDGTETDIPATPPKSGLQALKERAAAGRAKAEASLKLRLPVPRWETVVVEYGPVDSKVWNGISDAAMKQNEVKANTVSPVQIQARALAAFVRGVYLQDEDGTLVSADTDSPDEPAPHFNERLATALDIEWPDSMGEMVRKVYLTDFDIISTAAALLEWSGFAKGSEIGASALGN